MLTRRKNNELPAMGAKRYHFDFDYPSVSPYGIPLMEAEFIGKDEFPTLLVPFREEYMYPARGVHFYQEDFRFECLWNAPSRYIESFRTAACVLTPDFSLFSDWPLAAQIWNIYRRFCDIDHLCSARHYKRLIAAIYFSLGAVTAVGFSGQRGLRRLGWE